ncbi:MAG: hypothetical protein WB767_15255 [Nocardioides sp.]
MNTHTAGSRRRRRGAALAALSALVAGLVLTVTPAASAAGPPWSVDGPDVTTVVDGTGSAPASFSYDGKGKRKSGLWLFHAQAPTSGPLSIPWTWTGDHGRSQVKSRLTVGLLRGNDFQQIAVLINDGPKSCCSPGTTGFRYSGTTSLDLEQGDRYGFLLTGSHSESNGPLAGTFKLVETANATGPTITVPAETVTATAGNAGTANVSYTATATDPVDGPVTPTCTPASGSPFPIGDTAVTCTVTNSRSMSATPATFVVRVYADEPNLAWTTATVLGANDSVQGTLRVPGQALWYRFPVQPDSTVQVDLTRLAANFDITLFRDIGQAFNDALTPRDLNQLTAEFAADAFSPSAFSPSAFSPSAFSPSAFSPSAFSPSAFSPSAFSPSAFSPSAFSPSAFSPSAFSPSAFSPSAFSPAVSVPSAFSPSAFSPSAFSDDELRDAFSSAQVRSLIAVSARDGLADENVKASTWNATGSFYVRVHGRNGAAAAGNPFTLGVSTTGGSCGQPLETFAGLPSQVGTPGAARTVILTDSSRLPGLPVDELNDFAARPDVQGVVVDAAGIARVSALNTQADSFTACPYAKNLVAQALRDVVNSYRDGAGTLKYVVIAGDDGVVPFFRNPDGAGLGPEQNYVPPVADSSALQAALRRNQVLSQDAYGAEVDVTLKGATVAVPDVAVGRLVETPSEISGALQRFDALDGVLPTPSSALVTGYDFLTDGADQLAGSITAGLGSGGTTTELITDSDVPPQVTTENGTPDRRHSWTADDLRDAFLGERHDITYLAGHFSANSALAADYQTSLLTTEVRDSDVDLTNTLVISAGCHSGYNIVDDQGVPGLTEGLDWAQTMALKGATLIAGTGYQYGDTDFVEYNERLYAQLADELRTGSGPIALGSALVAAKQDYLATTPVLSGIHQKALAEATLYGLPMLALDLPGDRLPADDPASVATSAIDDGPGAVLGLRTAQVRAEGATTVVTQPFTDPDGTGLGEFTYLTGSDGQVTAPGQPALPLQSIDVSSAGFALRGVGFRGGTYADLPQVVPLTGAPATETHEVHTAFSSPVFFPRRLAFANTFGAIAGDGGTRLLVTPAQHRSDGPLTSTLRRYSATDFQLFYSDNTQSYGDNRPALAAPPEISNVRSTIDGSSVQVSLNVVGDPSAGIQQVWLTRTAEAGPWYGGWTSLDLTQDTSDSTRWTGTLALPSGQNASDVRFIVQAVNGVGALTLDDNQGREYVPGTAPGLEPLPAGATTASLELTAAASGTFGASLPVTATLSAGAALPNRTVRLSLGDATRVLQTNAQGVVSATFALVQQVGALPLTASFDGDQGAAPASAQRSVTIEKRPTQLSVAGPDGPVAANVDTGVVANLQAQGRPITERSVIFVALQDGGVVAAAARNTGTDGRAELGALDLPSGEVTVRAYFGSDSVDVGGGNVAGSIDPENLASTSDPVTVTVLSAPRVVTEELADAIVDEPYTQTIEIEGDGDVDVEVVGLPEGLDYADGAISGTPEEGGTFPVAITASSPVGSDTRELTLTVLTRPSILTEALTDAIAGVEYLQSVITEGDPAPEVTVTGLPEGLAYADGAISGTTEETGSFQVTITATNLAGNAERELTLAVLTSPTVVTDALVDAVAGVAYTQEILTEGDPAPEVTVAGLPAGLTYADGVITGATSVAGTFQVTITATSVAGKDEVELPLTVVAGAAILTQVVSGTPQSATFDTDFGAPLVVKALDVFGNAVAGANVTFTSPATGAGTAPRSLTAVTDAAGIATQPVKAGNDVGSYDVVARSGTSSTATFRLSNAYQVSPFGAPLNSEPDAAPVSVASSDIIPVTFTLRTATGPVNATTALGLVTGCKVSFTSTVVGEPPASAPLAPLVGCATYNPVTGQFSTLASGLILGWQSGKTYVLRVAVAGAQPGDSLGTREVRVTVR